MDKGAWWGPWGCKELDTTERLTVRAVLSSSFVICEGDIWWFFLISCFLCAWLLDPHSVDRAPSAPRGCWRPSGTPGPAHHPPRLPWCWGNIGWAPRHGLWRMMMREGPELLGAQRRVCRPSPDPHPGLWRVLAHSEEGDGYGGTSAVHVSRWKCDASKDMETWVQSLG